MELLRISERDIRRHGPGNALLVCWRQWRAERRLAGRGVRFRATDPGTVAAAYAAMADQEFDAINARQDWANWRTIPRAMSGHVPERPLRVIDLGCGAGSSTRVLACYCPADSKIVAYEMVPSLLERACRRSYFHRDGQPASVSFVCQPVTDPLQDEANPAACLIDRSVDLANASGMVGHHLNAESVLPLVKELQRTLAPGGIAMLDVGPSLSEGALTGIMSLHGFVKLARRKCWFLDPTGQVVYRRLP